MATESQTMFGQLAAIPGCAVKCWRGKKTSAEKSAKGSALTSMKNLRLPRRAPDLSDQEAMSGLVTASKSRDPKAMMPMTVSPMKAPWKRKGGKTTDVAVSGGM